MLRDGRLRPTEVDPTLARFAGDLDWLKSRGVEIQRFNLAREPAPFVDDSAVKAILDRSGGDELPAILVDGALAGFGRCPGREELAAMVGLAPAPLEMTEQVNELVALGAAVAASCEPCFKFHYEKARELHVPAEAVREAVGIGEAVKAASGTKIRGLAERTLGSQAAEGTASCCGPSGKTAGNKRCC